MSPPAMSVSEAVLSPACEGVGSKTVYGDIATILNAMDLDLNGGVVGFTNTEDDLLSFRGYG